jgi:membrane protein
MAANGDAAPDLPTPGSGSNEGGDRSATVVSRETTRGIGREAWRFVLRRTLHGFVRHRGIDSAASLTFYAALAAFPATLSVVSMLALLNSRKGAVSEVLSLIDSVAPHSTVAILAQPLGEFTQLANPAIALVAGLVLTIWSVSGYATGFGRAVNNVYEVQEGRPFWIFRARMMLLAAALLVTFSCVVATLLLTPDVVRAIGRAAGIGEPWLGVWNIGKWFLLVALLLLLVALLYSFTPNVVRPRLRWVSWGAVFAIVVWAIATACFGLYVANFGSYGKIYGWLGAGVVLLLWFYLSNLVLVIGAELDAELVRVRQLHAGVAAEQTVQLPLRDTRRNLTLARQRARDEAEGRSLRERHD